MTLFDQILWLFVNIRMLAGEPRAPLRFDNLTDYTVALRVQYWDLCRSRGSQRYREAEALSRAIIELLGPVEAARPLPPRLLALALGPDVRLGSPTTPETGANYRR